jgi:hypothetical protein
VRRPSAIGDLVIGYVLTAAAIALTGATPVSAQTAPPTPRAWSFFASAYTYVIPDDSNFVQPTFTADRNHLHLEARYNYEAQKTGSVWVGWNLSGGDAVEWELTPIVGGVFGDIDGIAPGYKGSIAWRQIGFYSESEYVIDTANSSDSFLYNWSELTYGLTESLRAGLVVQRTRAYQTDRDVQRGLIVGYSYRRADFTFCVFNPDENKPTSAFSVGIRF